MGRGQRGDARSLAGAASRRGVLLPSEVPPVQISFDEDGRSTGAFVVGANEKERIDIIRDSLLARGRAFIFHGERDSGKSALATQLAAVLARPYMPIPSSQGKPYLVSSGGEGTVVDLSEQGAQDLAKGWGLVLETVK